MRTFFGFFVFFPPLDLELLGLTLLAAVGALVGVGVVPDFELLDEGMLSDLALLDLELLDPCYKTDDFS